MPVARIRFSPLLGSALAAVFVAAAPLPAHAQFGIPQIVYDPTNWVQNARQVVHALAQIDNQRRQIEYQIQALRKLPAPDWRQIGALLLQLDATMREGNALAYSLADLDAEFRRTFPGYRLPVDYPAESRDQVARTLATLRGALNVAGLQARDVGSGQQTLARIKARIGSTEGHQQAIELQSTLIGFTADELSALRQAIATQTNAQAVYQAYQLQQQAQGRAVFDAMVEQTRARPVPAREVTDVRLRRQP